MHVLSSRILIRPTDFDASVRFYELGIGLVRYREWGEPPHRGVVFFLGGGFLELGEGSGTAARGVRLWLQVTDADSACRAARNRGVAVTADPQRKPWGLIEASVVDPDGLELVIVEVPEDHPLRRRN